MFQLAKFLDNFDHISFDLIVGKLIDAKSEGASVFIAGNGGSATIALHYATDWTKGIFEKTGKGLRVFPLVGNPGLTTAISNDINFEESIAFQLETLGKPGDLIVLISSSGKSANIIEAAKKAKDVGIFVIGISGFGKSDLVLHSDLYISIDSENMQLIEDLHSIIGHLVYLSLTE